MTTAGRAKIVMRAEADADPAFRPASGKVMRLEEEGDDVGRRLPLGRAEALLREAGHLDADRTRIERAGMPSLVLKLDHLRGLGSVLAQHIMRAHLRGALREPVDRSGVAALAIMHDNEIDLRSVAAREIRRWSPFERGQSQHGIL